MLSRLLILTSLFKSSNLSFFNDLVKISINCNSDLQYSSSSLYLFIWSIRKLYILSICLLLPRLIGWLARFIVDLLSTSNFIFSCSMTFSSSSITSIHNAWVVAWESFIYSALQYDNTTIPIFLELHDISTSNHE